MTSLQRGYQTRVRPDGTATIDVAPDIVNAEWEVHQISVKCTSPGCEAQVLYNTFFLCATPQGWLDTATGPPYPIVSAANPITVSWAYGTEGDQATVSILYVENPSGSTVAR